MVNHKKLRRIYTEEKLQVRRRGGRKRALGTRKPMVLPDGPNQRPLSVIGKQSPAGQREAWISCLTLSLPLGECAIRLLGNGRSPLPHSDRRG